MKPQLLVIDEALPLQEAINHLLQPLIAPFKATTAAAVDNNGNRTGVFSTIVHASDAEISAVPIDSVAAVIDCCDVLTIQGLRTAYQRIETVKAIHKTDREGPPNGDLNMTSSFIVAKDSELTLEQIAAEMGRITSCIPSHVWADGVAVLSKGIINYTAQIPGTDRSGDFFLPAASTVAKGPSPSLYVQKMIRATGELTLNKIASLIMARVAIFRPGVRVQDFQELVKDVPKHGVSTEAYQFNLAKNLVAMTKEQIVASQLPQDTFNIVSGKSSLGSVQFQAWQDGGVFIVRGAFPIDLFLVFLRQVVPHLPTVDTQYFRSPHTQVSFVLPMGPRQFSETLLRFQSSSSNISIQRETSKILVQTIGDEGTTSPFVARMMMGILRLRSAIFEDASSRNLFDIRYDSVLSGLRNAREASQEINQRWIQHQENVRSGAVVREVGRKVHISEHIDRALKRDLEGFLNTAVRTIKHSVQELAKGFGVEIGFLFAKDPAFQAGIVRARLSDPILADYLFRTRQWSEPLVLFRNNLEHGTIPSPKVSYDLESSPVRAGEPQFGGQPLTEFVSDGLDRIMCFVEEVTVYCLRKNLPPSVDIAEIPLAERDEGAPERFKVTVTPGGMTPWVLSAHMAKFNET